MRLQRSTIAPHRLNPCKSLGPQWMIIIIIYLNLCLPICGWLSSVLLLNFTSYSQLTGLTIKLFQSLSLLVSFRFFYPVAGWAYQKSYVVKLMQLVLLKDSIFVVTWHTFRTIWIIHLMGPTLDGPYLQFRHVTGQIQIGNEH